ncbi:hypothetical protein, partial [Streptomyces scabiei]|uniref:hypothetical protein n=1 Tax=Streptomyces scabiei TaxID=1930 RepID=UPI001F16E8CE
PGPSPGGRQGRPRGRRRGGWCAVTAQQQSQPQGQEARVAEEHRQAQEAYRNGQAAREGMDRADALRREMWGS